MTPLGALGLYVLIVYSFNWWAIRAISLHSEIPVDGFELIMFLLSFVTWPISIMLMVFSGYISFQLNIDFEKIALWLFKIPPK